MPVGTSETPGSKPWFSLRRLGKLIGFGITSPPGFFESSFLPPAGPARAPVATADPTTRPAGSALAIAYANSDEFMTRRQKLVAQNKRAGGITEVHGLS